MSRFQFVADHRDTFEVEWLCAVVEIARSSFYAWLAGADARTGRAGADEALAERIRTVHDEDGTYGAPRVTAELNDGVPQDQRVNHKRVARVMRSAGIVGYRHVQTGGSPVATELLDAFAERHLTLWNGYGGTEMGPTVAAINSSRRPKYMSGACGRGMLHTEIRLVDENNCDAQNGAPGEILLRGPAITPGYWRRDREEFFLDDWFRTGDIGRMDADGDLHFVDRTSKMFKSGNEKVYPTEVERVLNSHPLIAEAVVVGVPDERWLEVGAAFVIPVAGTQISMATLHEACAGQLARYKIPKHIRVVSELDRTASGKVALGSLRERFIREQGQS